MNACTRSGEQINSFLTRLSSLAEHCEYGEEKDNMTRDQVLTHTKDKNLKSNERPRHPMRQISATHRARRQVPSSALMLRQVAAIGHLFGARNQFWKTSSNLTWQETD